MNPFTAISYVWATRKAGARDPYSMAFILLLCIIIAAMILGLILNYLGFYGPAPEIIAKG